MKEGKSAITVPLSEVTTVPGGEEATTEALGEEHPTSPSAEGPAELQSYLSKRGGPFGTD